MDRDADSALGQRRRRVIALATRPLPAEPPVARPLAAEPVDVVEFGRRRALIITGVMLAALLQTLDATIVNVALPTIEGNIGASIDDGIWIVTGYIISNVIAIPLAPFLLQRLGRRQYYATCIVGFTAASFLCGTASSLTVLVLFRIVQGAFGGGLIATSQIVLRDTLPAKMIGTSSALFAIALTVGPALGPTVCGVLTDNLSWQWIFDINIVPGVAAAFIILTTLRNPYPPKALPVDVPGIALLTVALGSMQYVLDEGERNDWFGDAAIVFFCITAFAGLVAFVLWELFGSKHPIVDLRVFRYRNVRVGTPTALLLGMVIFGPTVILPQYVQGVLGFTATSSGVLLLMRALPVIVLTPLIARLTALVDVRLLLASGFTLCCISFWLIGLRMTPQSDFGTFALVLVLNGIGQSMVFVPLLVAVIGTVKPVDGPKVSSFVSLSVQLGGSIASTMLVTILDRRTSFHSDIYRATATLSNPILKEAASSARGLATLARLLSKQATNSGFADTIMVLVPLAATALCFSLLLKRPAGKPATPVIAAD